MFNFLIGYFCITGVITTIVLLKKLLNSQSWYFESDMGTWFDATASLIIILLLMLVLYAIGAILI